MEMVPDNKVVYTGLFVNTEELLEKVKPTFEKKYAHHLTIKFKPEDGTNGIELGKQEDLMVIGQVINEEIGIQACLIYGANTANKYPHITISAREGVSPVKSNDAITNAIKNGTVKMFEEPISISSTTGYFNGQAVITK